MIFHTPIIKTSTKIAKIYLIRLNGTPKYVGFTSNSIEKRWKTHCCDAKCVHTSSILHAAIRKYGREAFTIEEIYRSSNIKHTLDIIENEYITEHKTHVSVGGYNLTMGGEGLVGWIPSEKSLRRMSIAQTGRKHSIETRQKMSESLKGNKRASGSIPSAECRRKISEANKGSTHSTESRRRISIAMTGRTGRKHSPETRQKISEGNKGKVLSEETRQKISISRKKLKLDTR